MPKPLTAEDVRKFLNYDPDTGVFTRKITTSYRAMAGDICCAKNEQGYATISIRSSIYRAHRLAWLYVTGNWPRNEIDHINGDRSDNRWVNLRDIPGCINVQNKRKAQSNSKTGLLGASWNAKDQKFASRIKANGKYLSLGYHDTAESAHAAYLNAKRRLHIGCTL